LHREASTVITGEELVADVGPAEMGLDPVPLTRLDDLLEAHVGDGRHPGSLLLVTRGGKVVHVGMFGHQDAAASVPVHADTIWRIYSMTKPVTSVAAMMLCEEGALSLHDPVAKFIPEFADARVYTSGPAAAPQTVPVAEPMLIWHLLTHTSGLTYGFYATHPVDEMYRAAGFLLGLPEDYDLADAARQWAAMPLLFQPGTEWNYSVAADVVARVVEVASGQPLDELFDERIFKPLGMRDTGFFVPEQDWSRLADLHAFDPQTGKAVAGAAGNLIPSRRPCFFAGGHGLVSTATDYHRFTQMLLRGGELGGARLLSPRTIDLMTANHLPQGETVMSFGRPLGLVNNEGRGFGLGLAPLVDPVGAKSLSSHGEYTWGGAAGTHFWVDPSEELTVLFFTQVLFMPDDLFLAMRRLVYQSVTG
jgi:CubicO group peptidase (beta-lactamase class C family)